MIYTELTNKALKIAYTAHHGQLDKSGLPYIFHPLHLAEQMNDEISTCVAILHDVVEDTEISFDQLAKEFPNEIIESIQLLTRDDNIQYFEYIRNIKEDPIAVKVKLADLDHNLDITRFRGTKKDLSKTESLRRRYLKAKDILLQK